MRPCATPQTGGPPWAAYAPSDAAPWDLRRVVHLHRRAGFAATWDELQRDLRDGPGPSLDRLLAGDSGSRLVPERFEERADDLAESAENQHQPLRLKAWWVYRMAFGPDPLGERLALMWHGHFATSNLKVDDPSLMRRQNDLFRRHGRGPFGDLLRAVIRDPAMLIWLDAPENRKGRPNENLARELMELFTLGVGHYTERDVREAARALTGWTVADGEFLFVGADHDDGEKTILGRSGGLAGDDLLALLLDHPATADRLAWRICDTVMGEDIPDDKERKSLSAGLREHDLNVGWAIETVLRSEAFFREENLRSKILGPAELVVGALRALSLPADAVNLQVMASWLAAMGQDLFEPPNVGGWAGGRSWLSPRDLIARVNFARTLTAGDLTLDASPPDILSLADRAGRPDVLSFLSELLLGLSPPASWRGWESSGTLDRAKAARLLTRAIASPEYQLA